MIMDMYLFIQRNCHKYVHVPLSQDPVHPLYPLIACSSISGMASETGVAWHRRKPSFSWLLLKYFLRLEVGSDHGNSLDGGNHEISTLVTSRITMHMCNARNHENTHAQLETGEGKVRWTLLISFFWWIGRQFISNKKKNLFPTFPDMFYTYTVIIWLDVLNSGVVDGKNVDIANPPLEL